MQFGTHFLLLKETFVEADLPVLASLCCIWRKRADSSEQLAPEGLAYSKSVYMQVCSNGRN